MSLWFWVVIRLDRIEGRPHTSAPIDANPTRRYDTPASALDEAKRLAQCYRGSKFGVARVERYALAPPVNLEVKELKDPEEMPF